MQVKYRALIAALLACATLLLLILAGSVARAAGGSMRILFHGYVDHQGRTAVGLLGPEGISDVHDVPLPDGGDLSPDGREVAFDTCRRSDRAIAIVTIDTMLSRVVRPVSGESCATVRWSRDGTKLSYTGAHDLVLHTIDLTTDADTLLPNTFLTAGFHSWSPTGDAIVYAPGRGGSRRIDIIDLRTWETRHIVGSEQFGTCEVWAPEWSPIDRRIAFTTCDGRLFVVNSDGSSLIQFPNVTSAYAPRWSLDSRYIFFRSTGAAMHGDLMRIPAAGGAVNAIGRLPYVGGAFALGPAE